ncbi:MAG: metalloregulator ArsR/SmtB family transcription factor [bacterium]
MQHISGPARLLAALGNEHRLAILELLRPGERCVCEITPAFALDASVVSRHLAVLERAGVVRSRRAGRRIFYRVADRRTLGLLDDVAAMLATPGKARPAGRAVPAACCATNYRRTPDA